MACVVIFTMLCLMAGFFLPATAQTSKATTPVTTKTTKLTTHLTAAAAVSPTTRKAATSNVSTAVVTTLVSPTTTTATSTVKTTATSTSQSTRSTSTLRSTQAGAAPIKCNVTSLGQCASSTTNSFINLFSLPLSSYLLTNACRALVSSENCVKNIPGCTDSAPETASWRSTTKGYDYICGQGLSDYLNASQPCFSKIDEQVVIKNCTNSSPKAITCVMAKNEFSCIQSQISSLPNCSSAGKVYATYMWYTQLQPNLTSNDSTCNILAPADSAATSGSTNQNVVPIAVGIGVGVGVPVLIGIIVGIVCCVKIKGCSACCDTSNKSAVHSNNTPKATKTKKIRKAGKDKEEPQTRLEAEKDGVSWYSTNRLTPQEMLAISSEKKDPEYEAPEPLGDDDEYMAHF